MRPRLLRDTRISSGFRVLHSAKGSTFFSAEDLWAARVEFNKQLYEARGKKVVCPPDARLIKLSVHLGGCLDRGAMPFAIVDNEDFERVAAHQWWNWARNGELGAVAHIDGKRWPLARFILGVSHRSIVVFQKAMSFDYRKTNLFPRRQNSVVSKQLLLR